jgi:hypothetical protein
MALIKPEYLAEIVHNPWEWVVDTKDGNYSLVRADEETRKKQLEEFKNKRKKELEREIEELDNLY